MLGRFDQLFGGSGELGREIGVLGQEPARIGDQIQFMLAQLKNRVRPIDQGPQLVDLNQKLRAKLRIERLRALLDLAERPAELKGEYQKTLLLIAHRRLHQSIGSVGGALLNLLYRPRGQQVGDQWTDVFAGRVGG